MAENMKFCPKCGAENKTSAKFCGSCGFRFLEGKPPENDLQKTVKDLEGVVKDIRTKTEPVISAGKEIGKYVQEPLHLKVNPPAQWEVIVGEMPEALRGSGEKVAEKVTGRVQEEVSAQMQDAGKSAAGTGKEVLAKTGPDKKPEKNTSPKTPPAPRSLESTPAGGEMADRKVEGETPVDVSRQDRRSGKAADTAKEAPSGGVPAKKPRKESPATTPLTPGSPDSETAGKPLKKSDGTLNREQESTCLSCGSPLKPGAKFCGSCGASVRKAAPPPPAVPEKCQSCGSPLKPGSKFCGSCGTPVGPVPRAGPQPREAGNMCSNCGAVLKEGAKFCGRCGAKVT